jgi:hypothetical protein
MDVSISRGKASRKPWKGRIPYWQLGAAKRARTGLSRQYPRGSEQSIGLYGVDYKHASPEQQALRKALRYKGPGDYKKTWRKYRKYIPRAVGAAGGYLGGSGARAGWRAGANLSKAFGWGDYHINTNQIIDSMPDVSPQQNIHHVGSVKTDLTGDIIYSNSEFVQNIYANVVGGASPFEIQSFEINAGLSQTFPFLSQIAQNFELYEMQGLIFQYKPTSGEFGSNNSNALGKVVLCTNYDPDAPLFTNTIAMENYDYACASKPSSGCLHGVECKTGQRSTNMLYIRTGVSTKDKVFTDVGTFQVATEGIPSAVAGSVIVGELWVTYTVKLSRAKLYAGLGESIDYAYASWTSSGTAFSSNAPLGAMDGSLEVSIAAGADTDSIRLVFDDSIYVGTYQVVTVVNFFSSSGSFLVYDFPALCTLADPVVGDLDQNPNTGTGRSVIKMVTVNATGATQAQFDIGLNTTPGATIGTVRIFVTKVDKDTSQ